MPMHPKRQEAAKRLRTARMLAKMSQESAAAELHVTRQAVGSWEQGRTLPPWELMGDISILYGVAAAYLAMTQAAPSMNRFEFCPAEGRSMCIALSVAAPITETTAVK